MSETPEYEDEYLAERDRLVAENQQLRDALELALNFHILARTPDDETIAHLRAALAGTPSEDA
jgi:hypothetical protein